MRRSLPHLAAFALLLLAVGCETAPTRPTFQDIRFTAEPPLRLDVAEVDVERVFRPSMTEGRVETLFPVPPERAVENWVQDRLKATGTTRRARVRILDASVKEVQLPTTSGLRGMFTTDQAQRYDANVEVAIDLIGDNGFPERSITAKASRSRSVPEGITPNQRDQVWYDLTKALMADLDQELERQIRANFTFYVQ
jgi:hypothetical protein